MNEPTVPHTTITCNPTRLPREDPLKAAQLHNFALRLDLRRARRDLVGSHKIAAVDRLLDVNAAVARSLEWLNGKAEAVRDDFEALEHFVIEGATPPDAVEVSQ
jgi:cob(I)alamin adenosyltransferase